MASEKKDPPPWISHYLEDGTPVAKPRATSPDNSRQIPAHILEKVGYVQRGALSAVRLGMAGSASFVAVSNVPALQDADPDLVAMYVVKEQADE